MTSLREKDLEGDQDPQRSGRCIDDLITGANHGVSGDATDVGEMGEKTPKGNVFAEGNPVDFFYGS